MFGILGSLEKYPKIVGSWCGASVLEGRGAQCRNRGKVSKIGQV